MTLPRFRVPYRTTDSYQNLNARLGVGAGSAADGATYAFNPVTRNRHQLEMLYRGSWIIGTAVDVIADDMVKAGIDFTGEHEPGEIEDFQRYLQDIALWHDMGNMVRWGRLFGGCIAVADIEGQDLSTPLRLETIAKGQLLGFSVLDRWMVWPSLDVVTDRTHRNYGSPVTYNVTAPFHPMSGQMVHHSRVVRTEGIRLPHYQRVTELGWGMSVVERIFDRLMAFDSATAGAAQLVLKAYLRTVKVEGLRSILAAGGEAFEALVKQMDNIRRMQTVEGLTVIDAKDEWQAASYTFSGLDDVLLQFGQQLSGALGIPLVKLFGQSPAGLNATGESDLKIYYENIASHQERDLRPGLNFALKVAHRSHFGESMPDDMGYAFNPLAGLAEKEKADIAESIERSVQSAYDAGIIDRATAMSELKQSSTVTGVFSNITDDMIKEAEDEEPPLPETEVPNVPGLPPHDDGPENSNEPPVPAGPEGGA